MVQVSASFSKQHPPWWSLLTSSHAFSFHVSASNFWPFSPMKMIEVEDTKGLLTHGHCSVLDLLCLEAMRGAVFLLPQILTFPPMLSSWYLYLWLFSESVPLKIFPRLYPHHFHSPLSPPLFVLFRFGLFFLRQHLPVKPTSPRLVSNMQHSSRFSLLCIEIAYVPPHLIPSILYPVNSGLLFPWLVKCHSESLLHSHALPPISCWNPPSLRCCHSLSTQMIAKLPPKTLLP